MKITNASHLSDQELTSALRRLAQDERQATVALIVHLAEVDLFFGPGKRRLRGNGAGSGSTRPGTSPRSRMHEFIAAAIRSGP